MYGLVVLLLLSTADADTNETNFLMTIRQDVAEIDQNVEKFTFDVVEKILDIFSVDEPSDIEDSDTFRRKKRELNGSVIYCTDDRLEGSIADLRREILDLRKLVEVIRDQQITTTRTEPESKLRSAASPFNISADPIFELDNIKADISYIIATLNTSNTLNTNEKHREAVLNHVVKYQRAELNRLRQAIEEFERLLDMSHVNSTHRRSNQFTELETMMRSLNSEDTDSSTEIREKMVDLEKTIQRKKQKDEFSRMFSSQSKSLDDEGDDDRHLKKLLRNLESAQRRNEDIDDLDRLQKAIDRLRPRDNEEEVRFQTMLSNLMTERSEPPKRASDVAYICPYDYPPTPSPPAYFPPAPIAAPPTYPPYYPPATLPIDYPEKSNPNPPGYPTDYSYQIEDLRSQISNLQNAVNILNRPDYNQKPEDKQVVDHLQQQIGSLKTIVTDLNPKAQHYYADAQPTDTHKSRRSIDYKSVWNNIFGQNEKYVAANRTYHENDDIKLNINKRSATEDPVKELYKDLQENKDLQVRLNNIRKQFEDGIVSAPAQPTYSTVPTNIYSQEIENSRMAKNYDVLGDIVEKVLDKLIAVIPIIIKKLFNFTLDDLVSYDYGNSYNYDVQQVFKKMGILGYIPAILLRLLDGLGVFVNALKKNKFFRTFLLPIGVLATVSGSILVLIWFSQSDDDYYYQTAPSASYYQGSSPSYYQTAQSYYPQSYGQNYYSGYYQSSSAAKQAMDNPDSDNTVSAKPLYGYSQ